jgi:hypothetical protein
MSTDLMSLLSNFGSTGVLAYFAWALLQELKAFRVDLANISTTHRDEVVAITESHREEVSNLLDRFLKKD